jgi:hypothetical protein
MGALQCLELGRLVTRFLRAVPVHGGSATVTEPLAAQDTQSRNRNVINWSPRCLPGAPHGTLRGALLGCGCLFCQAANNAAVTPSPVPEGKATRWALSTKLTTPRLECAE